MDSYCIECDNAIDPGEDFWVNGEGPYCEDCWEVIPNKGETAHKIKPALRKEKNETN